MVRAETTRPRSTSIHQSSSGASAAGVPSRLYISVYQQGCTIQRCARVADAAAKSRGVLHRVDILAHERGFEHAVGDIDRVAGQRPFAPAAWAAEAQFFGFGGLGGEQERAQYRQVRYSASPVGDSSTPLRFAQNDRAIYHKT